MDAVCQERRGTNVYVSNLPASMTASRFRNLFAPFGTIIGARLVKRRKGDAPVGFVQYTLAAMAQAAIAAVDGRLMDGSKVSARLANRDKDKGINNKPSSNLYVANLPQKVTEQDLRMVFARYGEIHSLRVLKYPNTGVSKGTALVRFVSIEDATRAKNALHCLPLQGQDLPLEVKYAETKEEKVARRDDRGHPSKQGKGKEGCNGDLAATVAAVTEEDEDDEDWNESLLTCSMSGHQSDEQLEDVPAHDLLAAQWTGSLFGSPLAKASPPSGPAPNGDAMRALSDYFKSMVGAPTEAEYTENTSWNSQSSSVGHFAESLCNASDHSDEMRSPQRMERSKLSPNAPPFVPKAPPAQEWSAPETPTDSIVVEGLPAEMDKLGLYQMFGPIGAVLKLESLLNADSRTRTAIVKFRNPTEATMAHFKLNGSLVKGQLVKVRMF